jgi:flagellar hook-associated protein 1 FlgK
MSGLFGIINIGLSALLAHRQALDVRSHNLANVDTPGYSRQDAVLGANPPLPPAGTAEAIVGGQFGSGVNIVGVRRARESFLDLQARICESALGKWSSAAGSLREVESVLSPMPGEDMSALLDEFWNAWESVANHPEDVSLRYVLLETATTVADTFRDYVERLQSMSLTIDTGVKTRVQEVNTLTTQIAEYNRQITVARAEQRFPNDLYDSRDLLLDRLAELTGAMPVNSEEGQLIVYLDGRPLIQGGSAHQLSVTVTGIVTSYDAAEVQITSGEISGLLEARNVAIPSYLNELDLIAGTLVTEVNALHQTGFDLDDVTGRDFFVAGTAAADIAVDPAIAADVRAIAAASAIASPGDGSVAVQIANLRSTPVIAGRTINEVAQSLLALVGNDIATCQNGIDAQQFALDQIRRQQQSISGVSIDEELTYLSLSQRAYEAAARIITTADEMLAVVIERMGVR